MVLLDGYDVIFSIIIPNLICHVALLIPFTFNCHIDKKVPIRAEEHRFGLKSFGSSLNRTLSLEVAVTCLVRVVFIFIGIIS